MYLNFQKKVAFGRESVKQLRATLSSSSAPTGVWTIIGVSGPSEQIKKKEKEEGNY